MEWYRYIGAFVYPYASDWEFEQINPISPAMQFGVWVHLQGTQKLHIQH